MFAGIGVNGSSEVETEEGTAIPGLIAVGSAAGTQATAPTSAPPWSSGTGPAGLLPSPPPRAPGLPSMRSLESNERLAHPPVVRRTQAP